MAPGATVLALGIVDVTRGRTGHSLTKAEFRVQELQSELLVFNLHVVTATTPATGKDNSTPLAGMNQPPCLHLSQQKFEFVQDCSNKKGRLLNSKGKSMMSQPWVLQIFFRVSILRVVILNAY